MQLHRCFRRILALPQRPQHAEQQRHLEVPQGRLAGGRRAAGVIGEEGEVEHPHLPAPRESRGLLRLRWRLR